MVVAEIIIAVVIVLAVVLTFLTVVRSVRIVPQARARNVERFGRYRKTLEPGMNFIIAGFWKRNTYPPFLALNFIRRLVCRLASGDHALERKPTTRKSHVNGSNQDLSRAFPRKVRPAGRMRYPVDPNLWS